MPISSSTAARLDDSREPADRLSGITVSQLDPGEQFVLWALRQRAREGAGPSAALLHGFRLAFGLAFMESALATFEDLVAGLDRRRGRDLCLFPLCCAFVSVDERAVIGLVAGAQAGSGPWLKEATGRLGDPSVAAALHDAALAFALILGRAGLVLPPLRAQGFRSVLEVH